MQRNAKKVALTVSISCLFALFAAIPAFATFVYGSQASGSINGITYTGKVMTAATPKTGTYQAIGHLNMHASRSVAKGVMGGDLSLFSGDGKLQKSKVAYNAETMQYFNMDTGYITYPLSKVFYTTGHMRGKNSAGGYNSISLPRTPNCQAAATRSLEEDSISAGVVMNDANGLSEFSIEEYPVNEAGETYGSDLSEASVGVLPDLRLAYGSNGKTGYIKTSDFESVVASEAANPQSELRTTAIPLYLNDGETVIGEYEIQLGYEDSGTLQ